MKKRTKSIRILLPPVRVFIEDIIAIEDIYKEHIKKYKILTDDYEIDSSAHSIIYFKKKSSQKNFFLENQKALLLLVAGVQ